MVVIGNLVIETTAMVWPWFEYFSNHEAIIVFFGNIKVTYWKV